MDEGIIALTKRKDSYNKIKQPFTNGQSKDIFAIYSDESSYLGAHFKDRLIFFSRLIL